MSDLGSPNDDPAPEDGAVPGPNGQDHDPLGADEAELLAAFDRLRPQGGLRWGFDDAMRRIAEPDTNSVTGAAPWRGLPDDLWERGRSALIGRRFVGDVAGVLADILAADARTAADAAVAGVNEATWDALRYLAARVELLEARLDPTGLQAAELSVAAPDLGGWVDLVGSWFDPPDPEVPVIVGESGDGAMMLALHRAGQRVRGVEPRGPAAWTSLASLDGAEDGPPVEVVLGEVNDHLSGTADRSVAGVVLAGCVDRLDLVAKVGLLEQALRATRAGGAVVVLTTDQAAWDQGLSRPERDLAPGRPLHPETWTLLLRRSGADDVAWHRPRTGTVHALVARVGR